MGNSIRRTSVDPWVAERLNINIEELSQEKLIEWQLASFRSTMQYAKERSRFYKKLFRDIDPQDIRTVKDLEAVPCTSEQDLAGNEWDFLCVNPKEVNRVVTVQTTGTLGRQKRLSFTLKDQISNMTFVGVGFKTLVTPPATMLIMMSGGTEGSIGNTVERALEPQGIKTFIYGTIGSVAEAYETMRSIKPNTIVGVPNQIAALSRYGQMFNNPEAEHIKSVLLSADDIPDSLRASICDLWQCKVFNHYGMTEFGIAGGVECEGFSGYHMRDCDLLFEIINKDSNKIGDIVFTTLGREAMPLIRYNTGDLGKFTEKKCPCGSPLKRIEKVFGRKRNNLTLFNGDSLQLSEIGEAVFKEPHIIDYDCNLYADGGLEIILKTFPGQKASTGTVLDALKQNNTLAKAMAEGMKIKFTCTEIDGFPKEGNKKKTVGIKNTALI